METFSYEGFSSTQHTNVLSGEKTLQNENYHGI